MSNLSINLELPNGIRKAVAATQIARELDGLADACQRLGQTLVLSVTTTTDTGRPLRLAPIGRALRIGPRRPGARRSSRRPRRPRRFDVEGLRVAMREPGFTPREYARRVDVNSSLVYYHMRGLKKKAKALAGRSPKALKK